MEERIQPYYLEVGYIKGSGSDLEFRVKVEQCTTERKYLMEVETTTMYTIIGRGCVHNNSLCSCVVVVL